jgi:hypothetical protein
VLAGSPGACRVAGVAILLWFVVSRLGVVVVPLVLALFPAAALVPLVTWMDGRGWCWSASSAAGALAINTDGGRRSAESKLSALSRTVDVCDIGEGQHDG